MSAYESSDFWLVHAINFLSVLQQLDWLRIFYMCLHIWQKISDLITVLSLILNIANSRKKGAQPTAFNFIHDVFPRVSSLFSRFRRPIFSFRVS